jgi:hypothetical protein
VVVVELPSWVIDGEDRSGPRPHTTHRGVTRRGYAPPCGRQHQEACALRAPNGPAGSGSGFGLDKVGSSGDAMHTTKSPTSSPPNRWQEYLTLKLSTLTPSSRRSPTGSMRCVTDTQGCARCYNAQKNPGEAWASRFHKCSHRNVLRESLVFVLRQTQEFALDVCSLHMTMSIDAHTKNHGPAGGEMGHAADATPAQAHTQCNQGGGLHTSVCETVTFTAFDDRVRSLG